MVFLPYTPRADSEERGYHRWLVEVDNPFFNGVDAIAHYGNWAVAATIRGSVPFSHFDFMRFESEAAIEQAWSDADLIAFAAGWVEQWGREPAAAPEVNYHAYVARRITGHAGSDDTRLFLGLDPAAPADPDEHWEVVRSVVGVPLCRRFAIRRGAEPDAGWARKAVEGRLIAAP
ncbi:MAG: hypothetical protein ACK4TG_08175 [Thermaurantiacus sp.]